MIIKIKNAIKQNISDGVLVDKNLLIGYFKFLNYEYLSEGENSVVFEHVDRPYVLKVFQNDPSYYNYLEFCLCNQNNPFIPTIEPVILWKNHSSGIVKVEKLTKLDKRDKFTIKAIHYIEAELYLYNKVNMPKEREDLYHKEIGEWITNNPKFISLLLQLRLRIKGTGLHFDFTESNIMQRGDQLVIIDALISD